MDLITRMRGSVSVLELTGRFDAHSAPAVTEFLVKAAAAAPAQVIVNLAGVNFVDSTACAALVQGMKRCREKNGDLRLCNLQQPVRIIFELTRLDRAFDILPSEDEAAQAFAN